MKVILTESRNSGLSLDENENVSALQRNGIRAKSGRDWRYHAENAIIQRHSIEGCRRKYGHFRLLSERHGAWEEGVVVGSNPADEGGSEVSKINMLGVRYGKLVAVEYIGIHPKSRNRMWLFKCDCGKLKEINGAAVRSGNSRSCGCGIAAATIARNYKHGLATSIENRLWRGIKNRCYNKAEHNYKDYGGRGITVDPSWLNDFEKFYKDMGPRPSPKHQIDRRDNNGPYSAENCKWSTRKEQCRNKRSNHILEVNGQRKTIQEWAEITGIGPRTIETRLRRGGWSDEESVLTPIGKWMGARRRK